MEKWCTGIVEDMKIDCTVRFEVRSWEAAIKCIRATYIICFKVFFLSGEVVLLLSSFKVIYNGYRPNLPSKGYIVFRNIFCLFMLWTIYVDILQYGYMLSPVKFMVKRKNLVLSLIMLIFCFNSCRSRFHSWLCWNFLGMNWFVYVW